LLSVQHKIKLLIFIPSLQCGGTEKYIAMLCNNIDPKKFDVTLAVLDNTAAFYTISNTAVKVINLNTKAVRHSFFKIRQLVKKLQPHIVYTNANHLNLYFAIFKKLIAPATIIIARESSIVSINSKRAKYPVVYNWLIKRFYKKLDHIICQSVYMQQDLIDNYGIKKNKTIVINNTVEETTAVNKSVQKNKFITVARLSEEKGIDRLIQAVAKLKNPFSYYIIGDGNKKEALQDLVKKLGLQNNVFFEGQKQQPFKGMEDAAFFLMGSYHEGFPNVLLEAGACGIPVIAFNAPGGIKEIVTDGENAVLVKDNDVDAFAAAIVTAGNINFNRATIKESTLNKFSIKTAVGDTEKLFISLYALKSSFIEQKK
jgi:glycosyltransferase involved in cell wall biosynthesis